MDKLTQHTSIATTLAYTMCHPVIRLTTTCHCWQQQHIHINAKQVIMRQDTRQEHTKANLHKKLPHELHITWH